MDENKIEETPEEASVEPEAVEEVLADAPN